MVRVHTPSTLSWLAVGTLATLSLNANIQGANAINILLGNDDGWATANIRALYNHLKAAGHSVLLSAPATNQSGKGGSLTDPEPIGDDGGEFGSIPAGAPAEGKDANDTMIWYVNSTPAGAIRFALDNLTDTYFGGDPDLVVTGVNQGANLGIEHAFSGTEGAALFAVNRSIPAVAFSGANDTSRSFTTLDPNDTSDIANVYATLATSFVTALIKAGKPYMNTGNGINVNFPELCSSCASPSNFSFVQTRLLSTLFHRDLCVCGQTSDCKLPTESSIEDEDDTCECSVSVFDQEFLTPDADKDGQKKVHTQLGSFLSCDESD